MPKGSTFLFFSALCDFFPKFFNVPKDPPLSFLLFCNRMHVYKSNRVPPFTFSGTVRHFPKEKTFSKISSFFQKNVLRFFSLRYSADFRRSRLVLSKMDFQKEPCFLSRFCGQVFRTGLFFGDQSGHLEGDRIFHLFKFCFLILKSVFYLR